jgi:protein-L-isoaspartate(D-aspartate) O-methyltransferase
MVRVQLEDRDIFDVKVLEAMRKVPRHCFVPSEEAAQAYEDRPLPIGEGQTISQPYIVALMTQLLGLTGEERVLEVGTGSGYQAAILSLLAREVHSVERIIGLANRASRLLEELGCHNVSVHCCDGSTGEPEHAPYQAIIVTAAAPDTPQALLDQLSDGGRLVIPVGSRYSQRLVLWKRIGKKFERSAIVPVAFVPLRGKFGWQDDELT